MGEYFALIYDHWRSTRTYFLFCVFFSGMCTVLMWQSIHPAESEWVMELYGEDLLGWLYFTHLIWLFLIIVASGEANELKFTMPQHLLRLPVSTRKLVLARMSFGVLSTLSLALINTMLLRAFIGSTLPDTILVYGLFLFWPLIYVLHQAFAWSVGSTGILPTFILYFCLLVTFGSIWDFSNLDLVEIIAYSPVWISISILFCYFISVLSVKRDRQQRQQKFNLRSFFRNESVAPTIEILDPDGFASQREALRWFHRREQLSFFPKTVIGASLLYYLLFAFGIQDLTSQRISPIFLCIYFGVSTGAFITGTVMLLRGWGTLLKKDKAFLFIRPATTFELISTRWDSSARTVDRKSVV